MRASLPNSTPISDTTKPGLVKRPTKFLGSINLASGVLEKSMNGKCGERFLHRAERRLSLPIIMGVANPAHREPRVRVKQVKKATTVDKDRNLEPAKRAVKGGDEMPRSLKFMLRAQEHQKKMEEST